MTAGVYIPPSARPGPRREAVRVFVEIYWPEVPPPPGPGKLWPSFTVDCGSRLVLEVPAWPPAQLHAPAHDEALVERLADVFRDAPPDVRRACAAAAIAPRWSHHDACSQQSRYRDALADATALED